jgi:hypothetical protein
MEPPDFPNGHSQNFGHDHYTILSSNDHGQMVKIIRYFNNFNNKKSGIVEIIIIKLGVTILTKKIL